MTKQELINKLKELGVYEQWELNVKNDCVELNYLIQSRFNYLLNSNFRFDDFIIYSFFWNDTDEGWAFWNEISKR